jgi:ribulose-phosphate 3-epimerase
VDNVLATCANVVHFDVMENHYVPNLTIGPNVRKVLRDHGIKHDIDVHLMVEPVDAMISGFADADAAYTTFHLETSRHVDRSL